MKPERARPRLEYDTIPAEMELHLTVERETRAGWVLGFSFEDYLTAWVLNLHLVWFRVQLWAPRR